MNFKSCTLLGGVIFGSSQVGLLPGGAGFGFFGLLRRDREARRQVFGYDGLIKLSNGAVGRHSVLWRAKKKPKNIKISRSLENTGVLERAPVAHKARVLQREALASARAENANLRPIDFLLQVLRDPTTPPGRRAKIAKFVAPYLEYRMRRARKETSC